MTSREKILSDVKTNQPDLTTMPDVDFLLQEDVDVPEKFIAALTAIGGHVIEVKDYAAIKAFIAENFQQPSRKITTISQLGDIAEYIEDDSLAPHSLENVDYTIIGSDLAVAENGAIWITEDKIHTRVLPFISQHLAVTVKRKDIVPTMHYAYNKIASTDYGFATFIAGPSKTADIEQSLVLGAHGARSMTVFLIN
ncbi:LutC/YkgG family protein [Mucilaginibacter sp. E4BP6]|uniref:LutC/YkgG family protein n=1 Tax=Mucilaginibacter sp. E4BP6 TaxID=2723089 RepID=UPI0015C803EB|nr:LUD domain-containing protein [Mucilaginibacter sp. E4BP6]NYE65798.1 L-lactate dehydrogenase complex protein LldG [Mucilaginibacter sp. E4BP6]